jgi:hypothetical protein
MAKREELTTEEALEREVEISRVLRERLQWIRDICSDYAEKPREGMAAIKILINDPLITKKGEKSR